MPRGSFQYRLYKRIIFGKKGPCDCALRLEDCSDSMEDLHGLLVPPGEEHPTFHHKKTTDIIIPVFNGHDFLEPLFESVFAHSDIPYRLIVIDDASTDGRIIPLLERLLDGRENAVLLHNPANMGFVKTVNRGLGMSRKNNTVILNTDVVVPKKWLSKLIYPIVKRKNVASVTPLSTSSSVSSFPFLMQKNDLFGGLGLDEMNEVFDRLDYRGDVYVETLTGHGFCMAISRKALNAVGPFDEAFGRGYGEENDWCMRARDAGFINLIAPTVFCYHNHATSFEAAERNTRLKKARKMLHARYPDFENAVNRVLATNRYRKIRNLMVFLLSCRDCGKTVISFESSLNGMPEGALSNGGNGNGSEHLLNVFYHEESNRWSVIGLYKNYSSHFYSDDIGGILRLFDCARIDEVVVNGIAGYPDLPSLVGGLHAVRERHPVRLKLNLREPSLFSPPPGNGAAAESWRRMWSEFLSTADEIEVFPDVAFEELCRCYPEAAASPKVKHPN